MSSPITNYQQPTTKKQGLVPQIQKAQEAMSKLQKQFNTNIKRINKLKAEMEAKEVLLAELRKRMLEELVPLEKQLTEGRVAFVMLLDEAYFLPYFNKKEKEKMATLIEEISFQLIDVLGREDLIPLHDKYAAFTHAEVVEQAAEDAKEQAQDVFQSLFGLDLDIGDLNDMDGIEEQMRLKLQEQEEAQQAKKAKRKKTKAQLAKEEAMKTEMDNISKASRRIYTGLAKQLHPDRERDPALREWKEEEMKKVTAAYNKNDFFELLRLQMAYLQEKNQALNELPEQQLKYYITLLSDQLKELEFENEKFQFGPDASLLYRFGGTPKQQEQRFRAAKSELVQKVKHMQQDMKHLARPENLRIYLKSMR